MDLFKIYIVITMFLTVILLLIIGTSVGSLLRVTAHQKKGSGETDFLLALMKQANEFERKDKVD